MGKIKQKSNIIIYLALILAITLIIFSIAFWIFRPIDKRLIDVKFSVGNSFGVGFSGIEELNYGRLIPGSIATRKIILKNDYKFPVKIKIFATDNIMDFISLKYEYAVEKGDNVSIPIILTVPKNLTSGNYSGKIEFRIFRV